MIRCRCDLCRRSSGTTVARSIAELIPQLVSCGWTVSKSIGHYCPLCTIKVSLLVTEYGTTGLFVCRLLTRTKAAPASLG
jgi:hypothetical protein